jgi:hypothetical protein
MKENIMFQNQSKHNKQSMAILHLKSICLNIKSIIAQDIYIPKVDIFDKDCFTDGDDGDDESIEEELN